jgi:hypothetical protein
MKSQNKVNETIALVILALVGIALLIVTLELSFL